MSFFHLFLLGKQLVNSPIHQPSKIELFTEKKTKEHGNMKKTTTAIYMD